MSIYILYVLTNKREIKTKLLPSAGEIFVKTNIIEIKLIYSVFHGAISAVKIYIDLSKKINTSQDTTN